MTAARDVTLDDLHGVPPFFWMTDGERRLLRPRLDVVRCPAGRVVYRAGTTPAEVAFVVAGRLATNPPDVVYPPGSALGVHAAFTRRRLADDVVALSDSTLAVMDRRRFVASLEECPAFAAAVLRLVAR